MNGKSRRTARERIRSITFRTGASARTRAIAATQQKILMSTAAIVTPNEIDRYGKKRRVIST